MKNKAIDGYERDKEPEMEKLQKEITISNTTLKLKRKKTAK